MSIIYNIESYRDQIAYGTLTWHDKGLSTGAFSGPYGRGELPAGLYHAYRRELLDKDGQPAFCDSVNNCWMQVIKPQFSTDRTQLGIHPDGNRVGTLGCIGILEANSKPWYDAFFSVPSGDFIILEVFT